MGHGSPCWRPPLAQAWQSLSGGRRYAGSLGRGGARAEAGSPCQRPLADRRRRRSARSAWTPWSPAPRFADVPVCLLASRRHLDGLGVDADALRCRHICSASSLATAAPSSAAAGPSDTADVLMGNIDDDLDPSLLFSAAGRVVDPYRSRLDPEMVEALICTKDWVVAARKDSKIVGSVMGVLEAGNKEVDEDDNEEAEDLGSDPD
ncbi:unnamed protein product [Miscanthus lutarioriparius]|uniref:HAT C-terminal dimerisation domain-containing protein n=1 Tax=Miscanthus lutarioriparius TaxID=422564 RepID=A0A811N0B7_9POAL|nr:unnamed protein product [Miscanthus lutarioriparius]